MELTSEEISRLKECFGSCLRKMRREADLSQEELAFRAGIHRTYVSLLERGLKSPSLDVLFRICSAVGQDLKDLIAELQTHIKSTPSEVEKRGTRRKRL